MSSGHLQATGGVYVMSIATCKTLKWFCLSAGSELLVGTPRGRQSESLQVRRQREDVVDSSTGVRPDEVTLDA